MNDLSPTLNDLVPHAGEGNEGRGPIERPGPQDTPPPGYLLDAAGRLVPLRLIKPETLQRDALVHELVGRCERAAAEMAALKGRLLADIAAHVELIAEGYGVAVRGALGSVSLQSYDGRLRIDRAVASRVTVGEGVLAAEALVKELLDELVNDAGPELKAIVDRAFRRNKKGEIVVSRMLDFINIEIDDERWRRAQKAVREALSADQTVTYFRAYLRDDPLAPWRQIELDFSRVAASEAADA